MLPVIAALHLAVAAAPRLPLDAPVNDLEAGAQGAQEAPPKGGARLAAATQDVATGGEDPPAPPPVLLLSPEPWNAPSARQFPRFSFWQYLKLFGGTIARPVNPQPGDEWMLGFMFLGAATAFATDKQTHEVAQLIPDPELFPGYSLASTVSLLGEGWLDFAVFMAIGLVGGRPGMRVALAGVTALLGTALVSRAGKIIFRRERPQVDPSDKWFSERIFQADAFPSGHTMSAFATAAVLASEYPKLKLLWYALATWVGLTRIQVSTHWLSDVLVGACIGTLMGWEAHRLVRALEVELQPWAARDGAGIAIGRTF